MGVVSKDWVFEVWRAAIFFFGINDLDMEDLDVWPTSKEREQQEYRQKQNFVQFCVLEYSLDVSRYMMHTERRQSASHWASRVNNIIWSAKEKAASRHSTHRLQAKTAHDSNNCGSVIYRHSEATWLSMKFSFLSCTRFVLKYFSGKPMKFIS